MREIKFRGICEEGNKWVFGDIFHGVTYISINVTERFDNYNSIKHVVVKPETVGQDTGLNDKNGVEIYEGDIVSVRYNTLDDFGNFFCIYMNCEIIFEDGSFELYPTNGRIIDITEEMEVIGNIWQNPELLDIENV